MASSAQDLGPVLDKDGVRLTVDDAIATVTLTKPGQAQRAEPRSVAGVTEAGRLLPGSVGSCAARGGQVLLRRARRQMFTPEGIEGEPSFIDLARRDDATLDATIAEYQEAFTWWRRKRHRVHRGCPGTCHRGRVPLALACDLRVVADDVRFAMRETSLGLVPDLTGTHPLVGPRRITPARWRSARPGASSRPRSREHRPGQPRRARGPTWTRRSRTSPRPCWPRDAVIETKSLLRGAQNAPTTNSAPPNEPPSPAAYATWPA
ncbi:enoyl-CoA hydratase/isomerase family protein [Streptomyces heliomycini]